MPAFPNLRHDFGTFRGETFDPVSGLLGRFLAKFGLDMTFFAALAGLGSFPQHEGELSTV